LKKKSKVCGHACNPSTPEAQGVRIVGQPALYRKTLSQKEEKEEKKKNKERKRRIHYPTLL
jgi:hypothetical protein